MLVCIQDGENEFGNLVDEVVEKRSVTLINGDDDFVCWCHLTVGKLEEIKIDRFLGTEGFLVRLEVFLLHPAVRWVTGSAT